MQDHINTNPSINKITHKELLVFITLLLSTFLTCMIAGTQWAFKDYLEVSNWHYGVQYSILILTFLSAHEFGHYIAARIHNVKATLPFYIPIPLTFTINFGTLGAVIKTKTPIPDKNALFDIGVAGPLSGFIVASSFLIYGLTTLPGIEFIYNLHPEYIDYFGGQIPEKGLFFGDTLFYNLLASTIGSKSGFLPPMNEIYHYPFLNVGWFGLFVTALNLLPMGQLDGGHIIYSMFGKKVHKILAKSTFYILLIIGIGALLGEIHLLLSDSFNNQALIILKSVLYPPLDFIKQHFPIAYKGWIGWLLWALIARFGIKLNHPPVYNESPINYKRKIIGYIAIVILITSFSFNGIYIIQ